MNDQNQNRNRITRFITVSLLLLLALPLVLATSISISPTVKADAPTPADQPPPPQQQYGPPVASRYSFIVNLQQSGLLADGTAVQEYGPTCDISPAVEAFAFSLPRLGDTGVTTGGIFQYSSPDYQELGLSKLKAEGQFSYYLTVPGLTVTLNAFATPEQAEQIWWLMFESEPAKI